MKSEGRIFADLNPHLTGIVGQGKTYPNRSYKRTRAEHLAGVAHHNSDVRRLDAKGLLKWFRKKSKNSSKEEQIKFLEHFRDFSTPTMKMDDVFSEAARLFKSGEIKELLSDTWLDMVVTEKSERRSLIVASVAYVMSLYRGASAKFSLSSRMFAKYFQDEELQISHTTVNAAIKDLVKAGLIKLANAHDIILRGGQMFFRSATFKWLGKRPFDDIEDTIRELRCPDGHFLIPGGSLPFLATDQPENEPSETLEPASLTQSVERVKQVGENNSHCDMSMAMQATEEEKTEKVEAANVTGKLAADSNAARYWLEGY